jgi:hypothetical protein
MPATAPRFGHTNILILSTFVSTRRSLRLLTIFLDTALHLPTPESEFAWAHAGSRYRCLHTVLISIVLAATT